MVHLFLSGREFGGGGGVNLATMIIFRTWPDHWRIQVFPDAGATYYFGHFFLKNWWIFKIEKKMDPEGERQGRAPP